MSKKSKQPLKLNLGCGSNKIPGCVNIDAEKSCKPDLVLDFVRNPLPYQDNTVKEIFFFHTIEHIRKRFHRLIFNEMHRVLIPAGQLYVSYPNFEKCVKNWLDNKQGRREFWEATVYGLQRYKSDYHVCAMVPQELEQLLREVGFNNLHSVPELNEEYNYITLAYKCQPYKQYEEMIAKDNAEIVINK